MISKDSRSEIVLSGLDGSNPLAFLATLGVLRASSILYPSFSGISWNESSLRPTLHIVGALTSMEKLCEDLAQLIHEVAIRNLSRSAYSSPVIKINRHQFRLFALHAAAEARISPTSRDSLSAAFAAAFGCDAVTEDNDQSVVAPSKLSHANNQGGKVLLDGFRQLAATHQTVAPQTTKVSLGKVRKGATKAREPSQSLTTLIKETLSSWHRRPDYPGFRWDPEELRQAAFMARNPSDEPLLLVPGANALAVLGLTLLPSAPGRNKLITTCAMKAHGRPCFVWPLWRPILSCDVVASLLVQGGSNDQEVCPGWSSQIGVFARFASERRSDPQKNVYFCSSNVV